jgi:hypothetical protein
MSENIPNVLSIISDAGKLSLGDSIGCGTRGSQIILVALRSDRQLFEHLCSDRGLGWTEELSLEK